MSDFDNRTCPYCGIELNRPYWRHIQNNHPKEFETNKETWIQLFKDYSSMGMQANISILAICELFNRSEEEVKAFLKHEKLIK
ncbi:MAG: hypothetical protein GY870_22030 [archaeon]|nr:hypothetical protein [archaeon]